MKTGTETFAGKIERAAQITAGDDSFQVSSVVTFRDDRVWSYNDFLLVGVPLEGGFEGSVSAKRIQAFLKKVTEPEIEVKVSDKTAEIKLKAGRATLSLQDVSVPIDAAPRPSEWHGLSEDFLPAASLACHAAMSRKQDVLFSCIHIADDIVEATDKQMLVRQKVQISTGLDVLVPSDALQAIVRYKPVRYANDPGWVHFQCEDGTEISARTVEGDYPSEKITSLIETGCIAKYEFPEGLVSVIERAMTCMQMSQIVGFEIENDSVCVRVMEADVADFEESLPMQAKEGLTFSISPKKFIDLLNESRVLEVGQIEVPEGSASAPRLLRYCDDDLSIACALSG